MEELELEDLEPLLDDSVSDRSDGSAASSSSSRVLRRKPNQHPPRKCASRRTCVLATVLLGLCLLLYLVYYWRESVLISLYRLPAEINQMPENLVNFDQIFPDNGGGVKFDLRNADVMVFLHIQKTGGTTFGKHLVQDLELERDCDCRKNYKGRKGRRRKPKLHCDCYRPGGGSSSWLFSRYSTGWKCGLHPDWTELTGCVDAYLTGLEGQLAKPRRYFYITILREPTARYLSEFRHVQRGATWKSATLMCGGRAWAELMPRCYTDEDWSDVELEEFMACRHNLAVNRQTRMLANLELANCHNRSAMTSTRRDLLLLQSAKANLEKLAFFALTEQQRNSQYIFQETFGLRFKKVLEQVNKTRSATTQAELQPDVLKKIREINSLDVELYAFAEQMMRTRLAAFRQRDPGFEAKMENLDDGVDYEDDEDEEY